MQPEWTPLAHLETAPALPCHNASDLPHGLHRANLAVREPYRDESHLRRKGRSHSNGVDTTAGVDSDHNMRAYLRAGEHALVLDGIDHNGAVSYREG